MEKKKPYPQHFNGVFTVSLTGMREKKKTSDLGEGQCGICDALEFQLSRTNVLSRMFGTVRQTKTSPSVWWSGVCTVNWHLGGAVSWGVVVGRGYLITAERLRASLRLPVSIYVCLYVDCSFCSGTALILSPHHCLPVSLPFLSYLMSTLLFLCLTCSLSRTQRSRSIHGLKYYSKTNFSTLF